MFFFEIDDELRIICAEVMPDYSGPFSLQHLLSLLLMYIRSHKLKLQVPVFFKLDPVLKAIFHEDQMSFADLPLKLYEYCIMNCKRVPDIEVKTATEVQ